MIQDFRNLQKSLNSRLLIQKALVYIISTHRFQYLFESAEECAQKQVLQLIKEEKITLIKVWVREQSGERNLTELRLLGKRYAITNYGRLSKRDLIKALQVYV